LKTRFADLINRSFWTALDWIYPPECAGCGEPGFRLCPNCQSKIKFRDHPFCSICGQEFSPNGNICQKCREIPPKYSAIRSLADYGGVIRECIHSLKYKKNLSLGELFSTGMADLVIKEGWQIDFITPVPLSAQRKNERGYNQSAHLAKPLANRLGVTYNPYCINRVRNTRSQVGLSAEDRRKNVSGAFEALPDIVRGKSVLVVDDVTTTGSTLEACAEALFKAEAKSIYCLTLAGYPNKQNYQQQLTI
jgi:ComF family protein